MITVYLRPEEKLNLVCTLKGSTPFGEKEMEVHQTYTYEEVLAKLTGQPAKRSRKSHNAGTKFSRQVGLAAYAIRTGKWTTGATISQGEIIGNLAEAFKELPESEYNNVTDRATYNLLKIYHAVNDVRMKSMCSILGLI